MLTDHGAFHVTAGNVELARTWLELAVGSAEETLRLVCLTVTVESKQDVPNVTASQQQNVCLFLGGEPLCQGDGGGVADGKEVNPKLGAPWIQHGGGLDWGCFGVGLSCGGGVSEGCCDGLEMDWKLNGRVDGKTGEMRRFFSTASQSLLPLGSKHCQNVLAHKWASQASSVRLLLPLKDLLGPSTANSTSLSPEMQLPIP